MTIFEENLPREKMLKYVLEVLTDYELIAILLRTGIRDSNIIDISKSLISKYGIDKLSKISIGQLKK